MPDTVSEDRPSGIHCHSCRPADQEILVLEQWSSCIIQPCASLCLDHRIIRRDLEIPAHDQVTNQRHIQLTGASLTKGLPFRSEPKLDQSYIRGILQIDLVIPFLL